MEEKEEEFRAEKDKRKNKEEFRKKQVWKVAKDYIIIYYVLLNLLTK